MSFEQYSVLSEYHHTLGTISAKFLNALTASALAQGDPYYVVEFHHDAVPTSGPSGLQRALLTPVNASLLLVL